MNSNIKRQAVNSVTITLLAQVIKLSIGLVVTMILARLLTPKDYGVVAMVAVFTGFVAVFRDGGLSVATVQRENVTDAQISNLFWVNAALGLGAALTVAALGPVVAWFYEDESLLWIVVMLSVPFLLSGLSAQPQALLQREMRFRELAVIEIVSLAISSGIGITAAAAGSGPWALVAMTVAFAVANVLLVFFFCRWRPSRMSRGAGVRPMLKFGSDITVSRFFEGLACSLDSLLIGKIYTPEMVGIYTKAQTLMLLPLSQVMPALQSVALPIMSRLAERPDALKRAFLDLLQVAACLSSLFTVAVVIGADWIIRGILGPQWVQAAEVLRLLAGSMLFIPLCAVYVACLTAQGKGSILWRWSLLKSLVLILAILSGVAWGINGVAAALSISSICVLLPLINKIAAKSNLASLQELWAATAPWLGICGITSSLSFLVQSRMDANQSAFWSLLFILLATASHGLILGVVPIYRKSFLRIISLFKSP